MTAPGRRVATWLALAAGLLALGKVISESWPHENTVRVGLPATHEVDRVTLSIEGLDGEVFRTVELRPRTPQPRWVTYTVSISPQIYRVRIDYRERVANHIDKNQAGVWTTVGTQHQIRLDGGDHYLPPPDHEAQ